MSILLNKAFVLKQIYKYKLNATKINALNKCSGILNENKCVRKNKGYILLANFCFKYEYHNYFLFE